MNTIVKGEDLKVGDIVVPVESELCYKTRTVTAVVKEGDTVAVSFIRPYAYHGIVSAEGWTAIMSDDHIYHLLRRE